MHMSSIALLGPDIDHRRSLECMLAHAHRVHWIPDSTSDMNARSPQGVRRLDRFVHRVGRLVGTFDPAYLRELSDRMISTVASGVHVFIPEQRCDDAKRCQPGAVRRLLGKLSGGMARCTSGLEFWTWELHHAFSVAPVLKAPTPSPREFLGRCLPY